MHLQVNTHLQSPSARAQWYRRSGRWTRIRPIKQVLAGHRGDNVIGRDVLRDHPGRPEMSPAHLPDDPGDPDDAVAGAVSRAGPSVADRKSTRLNSSHVEISY